MRPWSKALVGAALLFAAFLAWRTKRRPAPMPAPAPGTALEPGPAGPACILPDAVVTVAGLDGAPHYGISFTLAPGIDARSLTVRSRWQPLRPG